MPHFYAGRSLRRIATWSVVFMLALAGCRFAETRSDSEPYFLRDRMWCANYQRGFVETRAATLAATAELKMALLREVSAWRGAYLDCRTSDGYHVRIHLRTLSPETTIVSIRVQGYGTHREVCEPILNQIGNNVASQPVVAVPPPVVAPPAPGPVSSALPAQPAPLDPSLPAQPVPLGK